MKRGPICAGGAPSESTKFREDGQRLLEWIPKMVVELLGRYWSKIDLSSYYETTIFADRRSSSSHELWFKISGRLVIM